MSFENDTLNCPIIEGSVVLNIEPSGAQKGPGRRSSVFYNPAMRLNRDITVLIVQFLIDSVSLPGRDRLRLLDGLCGTAIKSIRLFKEVDWGDHAFSISACDANRNAIEAADSLTRSNLADVELVKMDINENLYRNRYSFIDIDPFGSPVPYIVSAFRSIIPCGVIALTATDTAALSGSIPRVTLRRYGIRMIRTEFTKEMSCRIMMGYLARTAASLGLSIKPLLFYAADHYVRGFFRVDRGAKKADRMLDDLSFIHYSPPAPPDRGRSTIPGAVNELGPVWMGPLEDVSVVKRIRGYLEDGRREDNGITSSKTLKRMLDLAIEEGEMPPFGYDTDVTASRLRTSPPAMDGAIGDLKDAGFKAARSRFGNKIIKTDADLDKVCKLIIWRP
ncbi:MAG: hypothetical protein QCI82_10960 [Candidatus Thermoplasmatota archaeon]|nr:hypothetical protein [Candidatus Thermoplasmatota archaeon]